jgi:hypothetical protein
MASIHCGASFPITAIKAPGNQSHAGELESSPGALSCGRSSLSFYPLPQGITLCTTFVCNQIVNGIQPLTRLAQNLITISWVQASPVPRKLRSAYRADRDDLRISKKKLKGQALDNLLDALVWMRRKAKKRKPVDDLIDDLISMRRKAKKKAAGRKRKRPAPRRPKAK